MQSYQNLSNWFKYKDILNLKRGNVLIEEWFESRYQINFLLGFGHTSIVFRAIDTMLERDVAIKVWLNTGNFEKGVILKEGKILAKIKHPNIVKVYDYGFDSELDKPWTALEYLGKITIYDFLKRNNLSGKWSLLFKTGLQLANILDYLHNSMELYQLDIKPSNIALVRNSWKVKMMDLGSAFLSNTDSIKRLGTPGYIAPELFKDKPFTSACDIFSLGMVLIELITAKNPLTYIQKEALSIDNSDNKTIGMISTRHIPIPNKRHVYTSEKHVYNQNKDLYFPLLKQMSRFDFNQDLEHAKTPSKLINLLESMCSFNPDDRPSAYEVHNILSVFLNRDNENMPSIFVSHSHLDKNRFVNSFAKKLSKRGFRIWLDEWNLRAGEPFWERIGNAIETCDFVIVILSDNSINSIGVSEEIRTAQLQNLEKVKILPIRIDPLDFTKIPSHLRSRHILDFVGWENCDRLNKKTAKLTSDIMSLYRQRISKKLENK